MTEQLTNENYYAMLNQDYKPPLKVHTDEATALYSAALASTSTDVSDNSPEVNLECKETLDQGAAL